MATITFSYLDNLSGSDFLDLSKRYAKTMKKADADSKPLFVHQDQIAISLGFKNWSMLHKHLGSITWSAMDKLKAQALKKRGFGEFIEDHAYRTVDEDEAADTMKQWARAKYTRLIDFAFYDNESETGFSWPDVEMVMEIGEEFAGQFPQALIENVGNELELDGPWGLEEYGD